MKLLISIFLFNYLFISCHTEKKNIILVKIENSNIKKLYFTEAYKWDVFLDSAIGGTEFEFRISKEKLPKSLCSISYIDNDSRITKLNFDNRILSPDSTKYVIDAFIPDKDTIIIYGDLSKSKYYSVHAGDETKALFATQMMDFGNLDADISKRTDELNSYISVIKQFPNSQYLLSKIDENKSIIKKRELETLLEGFNTTVLEKGIGRQLKDYANKKPETLVLPVMALEDEKGNLSPILDTTAKLNMIILWASWCGPCRAEIPVIKTIHEKYADKGLRIVNISLDNSKEKWQQALTLEKMPWKQLIVPENLKQEFSSKYETGSIPDILFVGKNRQVIDRLIGYGAEHNKSYEAIIRNVLN